MQILRKKDRVAVSKDILSDILHSFDWSTMSKMMICGGCDDFTRVDADYSCADCGRMLCGNCGSVCESCESLKGVANRG